MISIHNTFEVYNAPQVVAHYVNADGLQPCEIHTFDKFIPDGARVLDIGVGGGRTTPFLAGKASRYLGLDYANSMVEASQRRFPDVEFRCEDATKLDSISNASFDVVVFSFNGIDYVPTDEGRRNCFAEVFRVLVPGGKFIFSSHNAKVLGVWPTLDGVGPVKKGWRIMRAVGKTALLSSRQLRTNAFYAGGGYVLDPVHGGLITYTSTPARIESEIRLAGFKLVDFIGHPSRKLPSFFVSWYYYIVLKP
jgi:SAM-dependent methyltransferase